VTELCDQLQQLVLADFGLTHAPLCTAMRLAVPKGLNHLPDELLQQAIAELQ